MQGAHFKGKDSGCERDETKGGWMRGSDAETVLGRGPGRGSSASAPDELNGSRLAGRWENQSNTHARAHTHAHTQACVLPGMYAYLQIKSAETTAGCRLQRCNNDLVISSCLCLRSDGRARPAELLLSRLGVYRRKGFDSAPQNKQQSKTSPSRGSTSLVLRCSV